METERLLDIKSQIEDAKSQQASINGELKQLKAQMKEKFNVGDLDAANKLLSKMSKGIEKMESKLEEATDELEEKYDWD